MNFTYNAYDFSLTANMFMNDNSIFESSFSAKNPPAACLPIIIPYIPIPMESCAHFFNICLPGRNVHFCMDWEFRVASQPIAIAHFDCLRLGQSGVSLLKPEDDGCQQPSSTILPLPGYDEYDEVTED
ncbi:hypothetical protein L9F63_003700 [Diploptera punctata]|uniref:DUF4773 domain-containing protein n=1 Tax=Diploptera punctata TaxID=6984 RepID=A0AAD7ZKB2_DIPPU|nr:hypothetical protein L9F63_003700 [Diploptera punctata]